MSTSNAGGKRPGAGRPKKEPTKTINFRAPAKLIEEKKLKHGQMLNHLFLKWFSKL